MIPGRAGDPAGLGCAPICRWLLLAAVALWPGSSRLQGGPERPLFVPLDTSQPITYGIVEGTAESGFLDGDPQLCEWALADWARASAGTLHFVPAGEEPALVEIHFVPAQFGQYGETRPLDVDGRRGAAVYIRPDTDALGPQIGRAAREDPLFRDTVVYLTCLHELGHALGLAHTAQFADIMYFFGFGGDIGAYFGRYRRRVERRRDIAGVSGLSAGDTVRLLELYPGEAP